MKSKIIVLILAVTVMIAANSNSPRLSPWDAWRMAYTTFEQGEEFRDKGEYTKAKSAFDKAMEYYRMVRSARPDWNQKVISERIADCERESKRMTAFLGPAANAQSDSGENSAVQQISSAENDSMRKELAEAKAELTELRRKNASRVNYETEIANLLRDQRILNERYSLLERRYRDAEAKLAAPDTKSVKLEEQLVTLRLQLDLARRESAAAQKQTAAAIAERNRFRIEKRNSENARLQAEKRYDLLSGQLELARSNNEKLQRENDSGKKRVKELMTSLEQQRKSTATVSGELQALRGKYLEKLRSSDAGDEVNSRLLDENKKLQDNVLSVRKKEQQLSAELRKTQRHIEQLRNALAEEKQKNSLNAGTVKSLQQSSGDLKKELELEKANSGILSRELQAVRSNANNNAAELKKLQQENSELKKRLKFRESEEFRNLTAANAERKKLRDEITGLEQNLAALKTDIQIKDNKLKAHEHSFQEIQSENRKLHAEKINYESRIKTLAGANANIRQLALQHDELKRNFAALQAENRQNKLAADAAKPREAELARIKLRLAELDGLKKQLSQEQSFNEQLNIVKRKLEQEIKQLRPLGEENIRLKNELGDFKLLQSEVARLRKLNQELAGAKQLESEVADLKVKLAKAAPDAAEAGKLRKRNLELEQGKILWENEIAKLKLQLAEMGRLREEIKKLNVTVNSKDLELRTLSGQITRLSANNAALEKSASELKELKLKSARLVKDQAVTLEQLRNAESSLNQLKEKFAAAAKTIAVLKENLKTAAVQHRAALQESELKHRTELRAAESGHQKKSRAAEEKSAKISTRLNSEISALKKELADTVSRHDAILKEQQEKYRKTVAALGQERLLFARKETNKNDEALKKIIAENEQLRKNISRLEKNNSSQKNAAAEIQRKYETLQQQKQLIQQENSSVKQTLASREQQYRELLRHSTDSKLKLQKEIELLRKNIESTRSAAALLEQENLSVKSMNSTLKAANSKNLDLEQELSKLRSQNARLSSELLQIQQLRNELNRLAAELKKKNHTLEITRKHNERLLNSAAETARITEEIKTIRQLNTELADRKLKAESELASLKSELANYNRLRSEVDRLRKLNQELADAKNLESELAQAKLYISRLEQMKDELSRQRRLNEELSAAKMKLESELASRAAMPAFAPADYVPPVGNPARPVGKAEDYISAGKIAAADEKDDLAIWNYRTALKLAPENSEAAELLGRALASRGDYAEAAPLLSLARNGKPDSIDLALAAANAYIALKRYGNADAVIAPLLKRNKENPHLQITAALIAAGSGKYAQAAGLLRLAGAALPKDPLPKLELARLLLNTDSSRVFEAVKLYETARRLGAAPDLELEPKLASFLNNRRNMSDFLNSASAEAAGNKDWNSVIWYNRQLIELDREPEKYRPRLAFAQYKKGSSGAALETLSMGSQTPLELLVKAFIHQQRKEYRESDQCALQAKGMNHGQIIEIPADWQEFLIEFRRHGGKLKKLAR